MDISIIIVNYNSRNLLYNCVKSIVDSMSFIDYEIIVVDNGSTDNSLKLCQSVSSDRLLIVESKENLGFGRANNLGVKHSTGDVLHFLNPDTEIDASFVNDYRQVLNDLRDGKEMVYVNPMKDLDGSVYYGKNYIPDTFNYLKYLFWRSKAQWYYIGATVIMSRNVFDRIGGWNEKIFMYGEDADIFFRINQLGIPVVELPVIIFHYGGGTSKNAFSSLEREILIQKSLRIYFKTNNLSALNYILFEVMMVFSFARKPKRAWWQLRAIVKSF